MTILLSNLFLIYECTCTVNSEIFARFSVKRYICDVKNSRLKHNSPISVNNRVISLFHEDFIREVLRKLNSRENF